MLVLSRKAGQTIWIGPDVKVTVVDVSRGKIRLAIAADGKTIMREELLPEDPEERRARLAEPPR